jgi:ubiquitin carboxyl-terminal hydrolase 25/28
VTDQKRLQSSVHEKEDLFSHLPVNVTHDGVDVYDGLSAYFDDIVEFEGKKTRMEVSLVDVPAVLQIQLQRVQFNRETLQPYKSQAYVKFGETIYLDRFMCDADAEKKARSKVVQNELSACRERLRLLEEGKNGDPYWSTIDHVHLFLSKLENIPVPGLDGDLLSQMAGERDLVKFEIDNLRMQAKTLKDELESIWQNDTEIAYELTSVFVHRGSSPSWGHYFFYSRHLPEAPDSWFKYNDSDVTVVTKDEILADTTGSTANPYLLVFARKGSQVVDTVKRFNALKEEPV